ncbi:hypothetical protein HU200_060533 [Digitaria exilis]|uniref:Pectinesterase inhibitor domain-containing protein n=1 Tax=Digitaria exilis TaxID=1010633 RepID=A0A835E0C6_9POAL|nr:hypothetical protein HU200_060532 [Digitaria exilis]KAF8656741.1 hypothetical protein HU200_060533 [Digitaria exilis]
MDGSSHCFVLLSLLLLLLISTVDSSEAPAPTTTGLNNNDPQKLCLGASDRESCAKVIESIPGIQAANTAGNISDLCLHFAANKTTEAKALADTVLAATKGKAPYCLEACAKNVSSMADVLVDLPAKQDDMNAYLTAKNFRAKFKHEDPPICEKDCRNKSSTADETLLANKFHDIWNVQVSTMDGSSHCFVLLSLLLLLLISTVDSSEAPAPTTTGLNNNDPQKLCLGASDRESCAKVIESIPGIQAANTAGNISDLCLHFAANKTTEAKALADTVLAATKGKAPYCLEACAKNVSSMADVLVDLPAKQDDMNAYLTAKNFRAKFKHEDPPICEKDCRNKSSTADETLLANKFHDIWNVVKVANSQIELMFPWPDGEDDDSDLA